MRFFSLRPKFQICAVSSTMLTCQNRSLEARLSDVFQNKGTLTVAQPPPGTTVENSSNETEQKDEADREQGVFLKFKII